MRILKRVRIAAGTLTRAKLRRQAAQFFSATNDCRRTQHDVLRRLVELNNDSDFSREHGLDRGLTAAEFRKKLPICDYEFFRSYVDQLKEGRHQALLGSGNRLLMFTLSSGTTSDSKFIPITQQFFDDYRRGWQIWGIQAYDAHPAANPKNIVQLTSDSNKFRTSGGTPCGNISGLVATMQKRIVRFMYTVPAIVAKIDDPEAKYYTALRLAVADDNIGVLMTANPSTLLHLAQFADATKDDLIRDIRDGTLSEHYKVASDVRRRLPRRTFRPNRQRAKQLEQIVAETGRLYPSKFWRDLDFLAVWTGGSCGAYVRALSKYYGELPIRDHGLSASEGRMTIPTKDDTSDGILDVTTHYFEFIPENEYGSSNPTVLEAHELQEGRNYFILLTTSSGFYRYDICDVVRCTGFHNTTPMLEFLHKGAHISSITGEKISESQIVDAIRLTKDQLGLEFEYFTVVPTWGHPPRYHLAVEESDLPSGGIIDEMASRVDAHLRDLNCEYHEKRGSGRLESLQVVPLRDNSWREFAKERQSKLGGSIEQYKHPCLIPDMKLSADFIQKFRATNGQESANIAASMATLAETETVAD